MAEPFFVLDLETVPDTSRWTPPAEQLDVMPPAWACRVICAGFIHLDANFKLLEIGVLSERDLERELGLGDIRDNRERQLLLALSRRLTKIRPTVVTFNGRRFDIQVLALRSLALRVPMPWYFKDREARKRYSELGHLDLCDAISDFGAGRMVTLDQLAKLIGLPGKVGVDGTQVAALYADGELERIERYCLCDAAQTALLLLRYRLLLQLEKNSVEEHDARAGDLISSLRLDGRFADLFPSQPEPAVANG